MSRQTKRSLTQRERSIVDTIAGFRMMNGGQIQRVYFPDGTTIGARRRTQATLKRLVDDNYLTRIIRRVGGERAGSASFSYCLGARGQRLLDPSSRGRRLVEPGLAFLRHHLAVAEVFVGLTEQERDGALEIIETQTEPGCWRNLAKAFGGSEWLKPDLFVSLGVGDYEQHWFIEVDLATESLRRIERTCDRYVAYYRSGAEQAEHDVFPRVAWLTPSPKRAAAIQSVIAQRPLEERQLFAVGLLENSNNILKGGEHEQAEHEQEQPA